MGGTATFASTRRYTRVRTRLHVHYGLETPEHRAFAESISEGGLHIITNEPLKVGTHVALRIEFPQGPIDLRGEVVWAIRVPEGQRNVLVHGMGIGFIDPDPQWAALYGAWKAEVEALR
jgi:uncharacterized protein (TIGR02266 family)